MALSVPERRESQADGVAAEAAQFARTLEAESGAGTLDVPSFPDVAVRVRRALSDDNAGAETVVRVVGSEPALAARVLQLANSAALNTTRRRITDLRTAITRLGFIMVRSAAIAFAVVQLRKAAALKGLERELDRLWKRCTLVAALAYAVARRFTRINADTALLAGLLHGIGRLYILTRANRFPVVRATPGAYQAIERDWHVRIARCVLAGWETPPEIVQAIVHHEDLERDHDGPPDLTDVLCVATLLASHGKNPELLELELSSVGACRRMQLDLDLCRALLEESQVEVAELSHALGP